MRSLASSFFAFLLLVPVASPARVPCDPAGADAASLAASRAAIDVACPCATAVSAIVYRHCARDAVAALVLNSSLPSACTIEARRYANRSVCGLDTAVACCRVDASGHTRHRIFRDPANCVDVGDSTACISEWQSTVTGCDAAGCIPAPPVCGNSVVEAGEQCDPPSSVCDATCQWLPAVCGDSIVETGEGCEPPGIGSCGRDCQTAPCAAAGAGETDVSCVEGTTRLSAAASSAGYLLAWSGLFQRANEDILALRLDSDAVVADASLTVTSSEVPDGGFVSYPSAASDLAGYYVVWSTYSEVPGFPGVIEQSIRGRRLGLASGVAPTDTIASLIPFGTCRSSISGPTAASEAGTSRYAAAWQNVASCGSSVLNRDPDGAFIDFASGAAITSAPLGFPLPTGLPAAVSTSPAAVASLGGSSLWVWHAEYCDTSAVCTPLVAAAWSDGTATSGPFLLSMSGQPLSSPPAVAAGAAAFLVTWTQQNGDGTASEVRGLRVSRADGALDPDGGLLLATVPNGISGGPTVAFDGSRWLVAWTQAGVANYEVRAVAVDAGGSVIDSTPRLVADVVATAAPVAASTGAGRVLVAFTRDDVTRTAIRATLVTP